MRASHSQARIPFPHISTIINIYLVFFFFDDDVGGGRLVMEMGMDMVLLQK